MNSSIAEYVFFLLPTLILAYQLFLEYKKKHWRHFIALIAAICFYLVVGIFKTSHDISEKITLKEENFSQATTIVDLRAEVKQLNNRFMGFMQSDSINKPKSAVLNEWNAVKFQGPGTFKVIKLVLVPLSINGSD